ncbi:uncharacterized protein [Antedon mediterranea]|uniref:uncharacterized protein n=1 Tax=Antedon mediterranea TaxID=105859 RepID=UPI003AF9C4B7
MVSYAVVCVVFNLNEGLNAPAKVRDPTTGKMYEHRMTNLDFILFWIRSVFVNIRKGQNNKIILIGTHYESLGETEQERQQRVKEIENILWEALEGKPFEDMVYQGELFTIENSVSFEKSGASKIILQIQKLVQMMILTFPIKWLQVLLEIQQLRKAKLYLPTSEINDLLARCKITDRKRFLEYLHDIGEILFYPDDKILKEKIVIDLMGVVDKFKAIITVIDPKLQPTLKQLWRNLNEGKLDERLLRHIWTNESEEMIVFFVSLMQTFGLMCEKKSKKNVGRMFYVLSRLKPQRVLSLAVEYEEKRAISLFHDFDGYLPDDLFQRAATKFIEKFQMEDIEPKLFYEHVELNTDSDHLVVLKIATFNNRRFFQTTIVRTKSTDVVGSYEDDDDDPLPSICKKVLSFLDKELRIFSENGTRGVEVKMCIPCRVCSSKEQSPNHMQVVQQFDKNSLPCGSKKMDVKRYHKLFGELKEEDNKDDHEDSIGIPEKKYKLLLVIFSTWYDERRHDGFFNMLKCVYNDLLENYIFDNIKSTIDMLHGLHDAGKLSPQNLTLLHDTIIITKQDGLRDKLRTVVPSFPTVERVSSLLSSHRQQVLSFFSTLSSDDVNKINARFNIPKKSYSDRWSMLFDLEKCRGEINEENWKTFVEDWKEIDIQTPTKKPRLV